MIKISFLQLSENNFEFCFGLPNSLESFIPLIILLSNIYVKFYILANCSNSKSKWRTPTTYYSPALNRPNLHHQRWDDCVQWWWRYETDTGWSDTRRANWRWEQDLYSAATSSRHHYTRKSIFSNQIVYFIFILSLEV